MYFRRPPHRVSVIMKGAKRGAYGRDGGTRMLRANYHTHTTFCDGDNTVEEMVQRALDLGFLHLGLGIVASCGRAMG